MVTLSGGVQTTNNVPLTGNVQQTVSPNSASAGGNVFNQTYAPDVTLVPRQPVNFTPAAPLAPLPSMANTAAIPGPSGSPINVPSSAQLQNAFAAPTLQGSAQRGQADSIIVGRNVYSPGAVTAQGYDPYGGYAPPQQQQPMFMQQPQARYQMAPRPLVDPNQWAQLQQLMPQIQPTQRMQQIQRGMQDAQSYARQAAQMAAQAPVPPLYMQNTRRGRLDRAMMGLTRGGQQQMLAGQNAYYDALTKQPDQIRQAASTLGQAYDKEMDIEYQMQMKNAEIAKEFLKELVKLPAGEAKLNAADKMMRQWPEPSKNPLDLDARLRYAEWVWQNTGIDLSDLINQDARAFAQQLENKELTARKSEQQIYKNDQTMQAQIDTIKARAKSAAINAEILEATKEYKKEYQKLLTQGKALDNQIAATFGNDLKRAQLESTRLGIEKAKQDMKNEIAKNYSELDKSFELALGRYIQAANGLDDQVKEAALLNLKNFGPLSKETITYPVPVLDDNGKQKLDNNNMPMMRPVVLGVPQHIVDARKFLRENARTQGGFVPPPPVAPVDPVMTHPEYNDFVQQMTKKNGGQPPTQEQLAVFKKTVGL